MFQDGICRVETDYYTKATRFQDINYQLAQQEDQTEILEEWCSLLNFSDSSAYLKFNFMNSVTDSEKLEKSIVTTHRNDDFDEARGEYTDMLERWMETGNNGPTKIKYLTLGIHAESMKIAEPRFIHIETDLLNNFKRLGVQAEALDGGECSGLIHQELHMGDDQKSLFDWGWLVPSGLSIKGFIAPSSLNSRNGRVLQMRELRRVTDLLSTTAPSINNRILAGLFSMEFTQIVATRIQSVDQTKVVKTVKHTITELDRSEIEEQKKAVRSGYDMDVIPSNLVTYGNNAKVLLKELQSQNERMSLLAFLTFNTGRTKQELENNVFQVNSIAQKHNCSLVYLDFQQEQGLVSSLPLAHSEIEIQGGMVTSSMVIFVPFTMQGLSQSGKGALYYGLNALSNNLIMVDRKLLKNSNGLILDASGSGKSFAVKREIADTFLMTDDDIITPDPEVEYSALVQRFGGQAIKTVSTSEQYINPMDVDMNCSDGDNPITLKADSTSFLCELIVGGKEGLKSVEKTVIDRYIHQICNHHFEDLRPEKIPFPEDLRMVLLKQEELEARNVATTPKIYMAGSLNVFGHRANVGINNRLVRCDIRDLGKQLKKIGTLIVQDVRFVSR